MKVVPMSVALAALCLAGAARADDCKHLAGVTMVDMVLGPSGRPEIPVSIGGQARALILDTGASYTSLTPAAVTDLGLARSHTNQGVRDLLGNVSEEVALMPTFLLGRMKGENIKAFILPDENGSQYDPNSHAHRGLERETSGVFGSDFLRGYDVDLDFASQKLRLFSSDHCPHQVVFWHPQNLAIVPMKIDSDGDITFTMTLDGEEVEALLDTGSNITVLNGTLAKRLFGLQADPAAKPSLLNGQAVTDVFTHQFKTLEVDGLTISNPRIVIARDLATEKEGIEEQWYWRTHGMEHPYQLILGMSELSKLHIYIDYKEKTLYVSPAEDEVLPPALQETTTRN
jgi:predicted aspartyl protease